MADYSKLEPFKRGDIVLVHGTPLSRPYDFCSEKPLADEQGPFRVPLIMLGDATLEVVDEARMNASGWYHRDAEAKLLAHRLGLIHDVICSGDTREEAFESIREIMLGKHDAILRMVRE